MINILAAMKAHVEMVEKMESLIPNIEQAAKKLTACVQAGGTIFWMGNGGSASDAQHLAAELVGRFSRERKAIASIALNTDTSLMTSVSNDYGYAAIFARQLEALCRPQDIVVGISTSGKSPNVLKGIEAAKEKGAYTLGFSGGSGGLLGTAVDLCLCVPSNVTARIQEGHIMMGHILCDWVEYAVSNGFQEESLVAPAVNYHCEDGVC